MNCKPGDLARIVAPYVPVSRGRFVTVKRAAKNVEHFAGGVSFTNQDGPAWVCEGSVVLHDGVIERLTVINDECLRPIRDPGDAAVDESHAWLPPVPSLLPAPKETA